MPRYIDAEELWIQLDEAELFEQGRNHAYYKGLRKAKRILSEQPTADVVERTQGKWMRNNNGTYSCSLCQSWIPKEQRHYANWCLFCGADMREEKTDV